MPAALERKLKKEAKNDPKIKDKDAYVYGTLRKTGWKPSTQKKMSSPDDKLIRLAKIDNQLDSLIRFDYNDDDDPNKKSWAGTAVKGGALVGAGAGGVLGHQAIQRAGGYGAAAERTANWAGDVGNRAKAAALSASNAGGKTAQNLWASTKSVSSDVGRTAAKGGKMALSGVLSKFLKPETIAKLGLALESKDESIHFDEHILEPTSGGKWGQVPKTKIIQEQFPGGESPGYKLPITGSPGDILKLPFPELMKFLKQRNILQQVFSEKLNRLIQLKAKLDEITG